MHFMHLHSNLFDIFSIHVQYLLLAHFEGQMVEELAFCTFWLFELQHRVFRMFVVVQSKFIAPYHLTSSAGALHVSHIMLKQVYTSLSLSLCVSQSIKTCSRTRSQIDKKRGFLQHPPWSMGFTKRGVKSTVSHPGHHGNSRPVWHKPSQAFFWYLSSAYFAISLYLV